MGREKAVESQYQYYYYAYTSNYFNGVYYKLINFFNSVFYGVLDFKGKQSDPYKIQIKKRLDTKWSYNKGGWGVKHEVMNFSMIVDCWYVKLMLFEKLNLIIRK